MISPSYFIKNKLVDSFHSAVAAACAANSEDIIIDRNPNNPIEIKTSIKLMPLELKIAKLFKDFIFELSSFGFVVPTPRQLACSGQ